MFLQFSIKTSPVANQLVALVLLSTTCALVQVGCDDGTNEPCADESCVGPSSSSSSSSSSSGARDASTSVDAAAPCGPHGDAHGDHCDCNEGYVEHGGTCVPAPTDAGVDADVEDRCAPHGETHGDHCHCDEGYTEQDGTCVTTIVDGGSDTEPSVDAGPAACAPHGELHGDHCHCDEGYVTVGLTCVAVVAESCGTGHRHGERCVCYAGSHYDAATDSCVPLPPPGALPPISFRVVAIGEDGAGSGVTTLNEHLQVAGNQRAAGQAYLSSYTQSVVGSGNAWSAGPSTTIGVLPRSSNLFSRSWDINWYGVVVGESGNNNPVLPFLYLPGTGLRELKLPVGVSSAVAHGLNDSGVIVGISNSRAVMWTSSHAVPSYLPGHAGAPTPSSRAWKINENGDIVGHARDAMDRQRATLWTAGGQVVDLGTLNPAHVSEALDLNDTGMIVGKSFVGVVPGSASGTLQAQGFVYEEGSMRGLGTLPSLPAALHSVANAVNDDGWIVGHVEQIAGLAARAVLWRDGVVVDLNDYLPEDSGWVLTSAVDVNARGDITGRGTFNGATRPFVLVRAQ